MLTLDPANRITIKQALEHRWLKNVTERPTVKVPKKLINKLRQTKASSMLTREAMKIIVKHLPSEAIEELTVSSRQNYFSYFDPQHTGFITADSLREALQRTSFTLAYEEIEEIISSHDIIGTGHIKYTDFLIATLDSKQMIDEANLWVAFKYFDVDNTGHLTLASIHSSLIRAGCEVSEEDMEYIRAEFRLSHDDYIDFERFQQIMLLINSLTPAVSEMHSPLEKFMTENSARKLSSDMRSAVNTIRKNSIWESYHSRAGTFKKTIVQLDQDTLDNGDEAVRPKKEAPNIVLKPLV